MLRKIRERIQSEESGFTLIELLVVILIVGILAAIALPAFLGQQKKGQDASGKSDVRNLVSHVESCFADAQTYVTCDEPANVGTTGLDVQAAGTLPAALTGGQVAVETSAADGYKMNAKSHSGNVFTITKVGGAAPTRTCTTVNTGGCPADGTW